MERGIIGTEKEKINFNCQKFLWTHYSNIPLFQYTNCDLPGTCPQSAALQALAGGAKRISLRMSARILAKPGAGFNPNHLFPLLHHSRTPPNRSTSRLPVV
jgi:hypothetical protein